jgi:hypothetical protein
MFLEIALYVILSLAGIVLLFVVIVALLPADFRVSRSATMTAPPSEAFAQVNDFHKWDAWSPWAKIDPTMKQTYEGAPAGVGAIYRWVGNSQVGEGCMTILTSKPCERIEIKLEFFKPFAGTNTAEFTFVGEGNQTRVTWSMWGKKAFVVKAFSLVMSMDKMIGGQFEKGLEAMKQIVEASPRA